MLIAHQSSSLNSSRAKKLNVFTSPEFQRVRPTFKCRILVGGAEEWTVQVPLFIVFKQYLRRRVDMLDDEGRLQTFWPIGYFRTIDDAALAVVEYVDYCDGGWFDWLFYGVHGYRKKRHG